MNTIIKLTIATALFATITFGRSIDIPSHNDLWNAAHVVLVSNYYEIEGNENQEDLPIDWKYEYNRVLFNLK